MSEDDELVDIPALIGSIIRFGPIISAGNFCRAYENITRRKVPNRVQELVLEDCDNVINQMTKRMNFKNLDPYKRLFSFYNGNDVYGS